MDYMKWSREKLIERIDELTLLSAQLLREKNQESRLDYDWTGNLGHWYWNIKTNSVTFNPLKVTTLGYELPEDGTPVPYQFFTEKLHPDDYEPTMNAMRDHLSGKIHVYEVEYRIQAVDGTWHWFYDRGKITEYDSEGKPISPGVTAGRNSSWFLKTPPWKPHVRSVNVFGSKLRHFPSQIPSRLPSAAAYASTGAKA